MRSAPLPRLRPAAVLLLIVVAGCFGSRPATTPLTDEERARNAALTVVDADELASAAASGATVVQVLITRVPSLRQMRGQGMRTDCPVFVLRGNSSIQQVTEPDYYVDTSRANDSCVLLTVSPQELRAIEVYASGTAPPGIMARARTGGAIVLRTRIR